MKFSLRKKKHFYQSKLFLIFFSIVLFLIVLRMILPTIIVTMANKRLEKESPNFSFHIDDIDLKIIRGQYVVQGIEGFLKPSGQNFLNIEEVTTFVPWSEIFKGKVVTDVLVEELSLIVSQEVLDKAKSEAKRVQKIVKEKLAEKKDKDKESKLVVRSFRMKESNVTIQDFLSFKGKDTRKVTKIDVQATNITPTEDDPNTKFSVNAHVFGPAPLKVDGLAQLEEKPLAWDANISLKNFELPTINPFIKDKLKSYIQKGKLDEYVEVKAREGLIEGYMKPFVRKFKMDTPEGGFEFKGEAAKTGGNLVKQLLTDSEVKTLATKVPFKFKEKKLEVDIIPALKLAVEHKLKQNIKPGIENTVELGSQPIKQAEEAKKIDDDKDE